MHNFVNEITLFIEQASLYIKPWAMIMGILWCVDIINWIVGSPLNFLGIYPRRLYGLIGIPFSPFLHQNFAHLLLNSIPLFVLGLAILTQQGWTGFAWITAVIIIIGGLGVWLFARKGIHIGASGLISGYFGYILMTAYKNPGVITILLAVLTIYYFGGIFSGIFPKQKKISWEAHFFGFLAGLLCIYIRAILANFTT